MQIQNINQAVQMPPPVKTGQTGSSANSAAVRHTPVTAAPITAAPITATPITTAPSAAPTENQLQSAVKSANQAMASSNKDLSFSVDNDTKQTVVKLTDSKTGDVIGQFPSHQMLAISKAIGLMQDQLQQAALSKASVPSTQGMLIKQQA